MKGWLAQEDDTETEWAEELARSAKALRTRTSAMAAEIGGAVGLIAAATRIYEALVGTGTTAMPRHGQREGCTA